jgi:hypothetical protein
VRVGSCVRARVDTLDSGKVLAKDVVLLPDNSVVLFVRDGGDEPQRGVVERVAKPHQAGSIAPADGGAALPFALGALAAKSDEDASLVTFAGGHVELIKGDVVEFVREKHARSGALRAAAVRLRTPKGADAAELTHGRIEALPHHKRREERGALVVHDAAKTKLSFAGTQLLSVQRIAPGMEVSFVALNDKAYRVRLRSGDIVGSQQWTGVVASGAAEIAVTPATAEETAAAAPADNALLDKRGARPATVSLSAATGRGKRHDQPAAGDTVRFTPMRRGKHLLARHVVIVTRHQPEPAAVAAESASPATKQPKISAQEAGVTLLRTPINHDNSRGFVGKREFTAADRQALIEKATRAPAATTKQ